MKKLYLLPLMLLAITAASAQLKITGIVQEKITGKILPGATIYLHGTYTGAIAAYDGTYSIEASPRQHYTLVVRYIGFSHQQIPLYLTRDTTINIYLEPAPVLTDEVVITATRAGQLSATAYTIVKKDELAKINTAVDLPYLLETVPSLVPTSDAGNGIGYTGVRIRGTDAGRINVTIDGIPINDAESHNVYWVDLPDLTSSVDNIQVQRGAGTSTNGAGAFGGSINIKTSDPSPTPLLTTSLTAGSFNTIGMNAIIGSGIINDRWNFEGRLSKINSDGYMDRASSDLKSFYISAIYKHNKDRIKLNVFSGKEITYQSWYGVPEAALDTNRTWNYYTYENQVDDYQQDHYQLHYSRELTPKIAWNTAFHYTRGRGFYEEFRENDPLSDYLLSPVIIGNDTIFESDIIRRKWLDNDFYGLTWSINYFPSRNNSILFGGAYNEYDGGHFGEVIWARYASNGFINHKYYSNNGFKTDMNVFGKSTFMLFKKLSLFADMQYRTVSYDFTGPGSDLQPAPQNAELHFFNPKAGITWLFNANRYAYMSFSVANKEPSRDDYTQSTSASRPRHETLYDIESGYRHTNIKYSFGLNYYRMMYENQLALTGKLNDVGNYTRTNIRESYREGIEADATCVLFNRLSLMAHTTLSRNKIKSFTEYIDDYDTGTQISRDYKNTDLAFSPSVTGFLRAEWKIISAIHASLVTRYTGKQYLDNTSASSRSLDPYYITDFRLHINMVPKFMKSIKVSAMINNLFDLKYESNGYTFGYIYGGETVRENYYYPQAGRNFMIKLELNF